MSIKRFALLAISGLTALLPVHSRAQELPFTHYTPESETNALPSAEVSAVYQDRQGYIWFVIFSSGLVRYDGHSSQLYTPADGLLDPNPWDVIEDGAGHLWVGSNEGLVVSEKPLNDYPPGERIHFAGTIGGHALPRGATIDRNRMALDPSGRLWVGTNNLGILRIAPNGTDIDTLSIDVRGEGTSPGVRSLVARRDGSVWAAVTGASDPRWHEILVFGKDETKPVRVSGQHGVPSENVNAMHETAEGVL